MASDIRETKFGQQLHQQKERLDAEFSPRRWPARIVQIALGAWLFFTAFIWPHGSYGFHLAWISGLLFIGLAVASAFVPWVRLILGLACVWFLLATFFTSEPPITLANNLFVAMFIFVFNFLPTSPVALFREERERRQPA
ncbi:MAG: hypothetical protein WBV82_03790 [Myxococcaceae bacterium]